MRFLIIGAGSLGGYYGGMLQKGGADVTFLVRPRRAAQLAERGLVIKTSDNEFVAPVRTVLAGAPSGPYDVVLLVCKAYDLDSAIADFAPMLAPDGVALPLLNGINHIAGRTFSQPTGTLCWSGPRAIATMTRCCAKRISPTPFHLAS